MGTVSLGRWRGSVPVLITLIVLLVALADWLFFRRPIGWTLGLYLLVLVAVIGARAGGAWVGRSVAILVALLVGLAVAHALEPGPLVVLLSVVGVGGLAVVSRSGWTWSLLAWIERAARLMIAPVVVPLLDAVASSRWAKRAAHGGARRAGVLTRWALPVALSLVFVALFWIANPVVASGMRRAWEAIDAVVGRLDELVAPARVLLWVATATGAWALLRVRARRARMDAMAIGATLPHIPVLDRVLSVDAVVRCLVLFNAVFAVQTVLDATYLWGGAALPEGMTYAEYAHRGAYPLVATALLAGAFVLVTFRAGGPAERSPLARRLVYAWVAQNILLLVSAAWRLRLYVDVYSLTMWRIAAALWMLLVALGLAWTVYRIVAGRDNAWLVRANVLTALALLYACCFPDFAGGVAWFNVQRCREVGGPGVSIDVAYLQSLGPEALPALRWLQARANDSPAAQRAVDAEAQLRAELDAQLRDWRGWTWRRAQVAEEIGEPVRVTGL